MTSSNRNTRYVHLPAALLISLLAACLYLPERLSSPPELTLPELAPVAVSPAEARLALGLKIPLKHADIYDLELIPGISDVLAQRLVKAKLQILIRSAYSQGASVEKALEVVHGIGEKKAATFGEQLELGD